MKLYFPKEIVGCVTLGFLRRANEAERGPIRSADKKQVTFPKIYLGKIIEEEL